MKPTTTNQVRQFAVSNQYIREYINGDTYDQHPLYRRLGRSFNIHIEYRGRTSVYDCSTQFRNQRSRRAWSDAFSKFGEKFFDRKYSTVMFEYYKFHYRYEVSIDGVVGVSIHNASIGDDSFRVLPFFSDTCEPVYEHCFVYKGLISEELISRAVLNEIEKALFAPGKWRDIQISQFKHKASVIRMYKYYLENYKPKYYQAYDEDEMLAWLKRHKNVLDYNSFSGLTLDSVVNLFRTHKGLDKPMKIAKYSFSWIYDFDGDVDEIETEYYNSLEEQTIYV